MENGIRQDSSAHQPVYQVLYLILSSGFYELLHSIHARMSSSIVKMKFIMQVIFSNKLWKFCTATHPEKMQCKAQIYWLMSQSLEELEDDILDVGLNVVIPWDGLQRNQVKQRMWLHLKQNSNY